MTVPFTPLEGTEGTPIVIGTVVVHHHHEDPQIKEILMTMQDELGVVKEKLTEASTEIVAKLDDLAANLRAGTVDPNTMAQVRALAEGLADIVPNPEPEPPAEPETPVEPEAPAEEAPVEETPVEEPAPSE